MLNVCLIGQIKLSQIVTNVTDNVRQYKMFRHWIDLDSITILAIKKRCQVDFVLAHDYLSVVQCR